MTLTEEGKIMLNESEVGITFNKFFVKITESLGIFENQILFLLLKILEILLIKYHLGSQGTQVFKIFIPWI